MPVKTFRNNSPPMNFYLSSILLITNIPTIITFLIFPSSHFVYLTYDSNSIDKSLNLPPPVRPYSHQSNIPPSNETISTASIRTLSSSSHPVTNPTSSSTQHISPPTSQDTSLNHNNPPSTSQITTIHNNPPLSHSPNQYTTPSNTPPAVISNPVQHSTFQIPTLNPIPLPLNTTIPAQFLSQNPPSSSTQNHSNLQTTSSTTQSTSYNPYISLYPTFQSFPTNSFQPPSKSP